MKPAGLSFEEAAALPQAAVLALQGLRKGHVRPGLQVLINGAGGGVGSFAVQMATSFGADVTGVDSPAKLEMVRSIGAVHVIDYTEEDFTQTGRRYDLILDVAAHHSLFAYERTLNPGGSYVLVGGSMAALVQVWLIGPGMAAARNKRMSLLMRTPNKDLATVSELVQTGQFAPVIDKRYPLSRVAEAVRISGRRKRAGKGCHHYVRSRQHPSPKLHQRQVLGQAVSRVLKDVGAAGLGSVPQARIVHEGCVLVVS